MKKKFLSRLATIAGIIAIVLISGMAVNAEAYDRQSNDENSVRVDVLPLELATGKPIKFEIRMNTHSVSLDNDMVAGSVLQDDSGVEYNALKWDGTPPGNHHRSGTLEFPALQGNPKSITLIIKDVSDVSQRIFKWTIE